MFLKIDDQIMIKNVVQKLIMTFIRLFLETEKK